MKYKTVKRWLKRIWAERAKSLCVCGELHLNPLLSIFYLTNFGTYALFPRFVLKGQDALCSKSSHFICLVDFIFILF